MGQSWAITMKPGFLSKLLALPSGASHRVEKKLTLLFDWFDPVHWNTGVHWQRED
jgi:hypothetical protein